MAATFLRRALLLALLASAMALPATAQAPGHPHPGTTTFATGHDFETLRQRLEAAVQANGMAVVTRASASAGAAARGVSIPGNMVVGVYRNDFAVRMLAASVPAGIEAPLRFYLTENGDGTASLTWRRPSAVFAPYGEAELDAMARELDAIWERIVGDTTGN